MANAKFREKMRQKLAEDRDETSTNNARESATRDNAAEKIVDQATTSEAETRQAEAEADKSEAEKTITRQTRRRPTPKPQNQMQQAATKATIREVKWKNQLHVFFALSCAVILKITAKGHP